jgi:small basic protein
MPALESVSNTPNQNNLRTHEMALVSTAPLTNDFKPLANWTQTVPWWLPATVAVAILFGFSILVVFMLDNAAGDSWERYVFIYSSILNIVIAAASALLGVQISAQQTAVAQQQGAVAQEKANRLETNIKSLQKDVSRSKRLSERGIVQSPDDFTMRIMTLNH